MRDGSVSDDNVTIKKEKPQVMKRRAMRYGPLDDLKRERAALVRKLGACSNCKKRRVKVSTPMACRSEAELFANLYPIYSVTISTSVTSKHSTCSRPDPSSQPPVHFRPWKEMSPRSLPGPPM